MVRHHIQKRERHWKKSLAINLIGATTTGGVLVVVTITKFTNGAWMVIVLIPTMVMMLKKINKHYLEIGKELSLRGKQAPAQLPVKKSCVVLPISGLHRGVIEALRYSMSISDDVRVCSVDLTKVGTERLQKEWEPLALKIPLIVLESPYRSVLTPVLDYVDRVLLENPGKLVTVIIPEFITTRWWQKFLHNQTAFFLRVNLVFKPRVVVTRVRYHLDAE
jgi:hypothetical protein